MSVSNHDGAYSSATVMDVLVACIESSVSCDVTSAAAIAKLGQEWVLRKRILKAPEMAALRRRPDTMHLCSASNYTIRSTLGERGSFLKLWSTFVTRKFIKFGASEGALARLKRSASSSELTLCVSLMSNNTHFDSTVADELQHLQLDEEYASWATEHVPVSVDVARAFVNSFVFLLIAYDRPVIAMRLIFSVFLAIFESQWVNESYIPQLLSYLMPNVQINILTPLQQLDQIQKKMEARGLSVKVSTENLLGLKRKHMDLITKESGVWAAKKWITVSPELLKNIMSEEPSLLINCRVERHDGSDEERCSLSFSEYLSELKREYREYFFRVKQSAKIEVRETLRPLLLATNADMLVIWKIVRLILRFSPTYIKKIQSRVPWSDFIKSEGWVPLSCIDEELKNSPNKAISQLSYVERNQIVESLLLQHDTFKRFELTPCPLPHSPFFGQICARALYGHAIRSPPLFKQILCKPEALIDGANEAALRKVPLYGWIFLKSSTLRIMLKNPSLLVLPDHMPLATVLPAEALGVFKRYMETTNPEMRYDERFKENKLHFAEVCLRAIARDGAIPSPPTSEATADEDDESEGVSESNDPTTSSVYVYLQEDTRAESQRWYVLPAFYTTGATNHTLSRHRPSSCAATIGLPKIFFTGRIAQLTNPADDPEQPQERLAGSSDGGEGLLSVSPSTHERRGTAAEFEPDQGGTREAGVQHHQCAITVSTVPMEALPQIVFRRPSEEAATDESTAALSNVCHLFKASTTAPLYGHVFSSQRLTAVFADYELPRVNEDEWSSRTEVNEQEEVVVEKEKEVAVVKTFDEAPYLADLITFMADPNRSSFVLSIQLSSPDGQLLTGCRKGVSSIRQFAVQRGLQVRRLDHEPDDQISSTGTGTTASPPSNEGDPASKRAIVKEYFEYRKRVVWQREDLLHVLEEIQLSPDEVPTALLVQALTREVDDRNENYEQLEFLGDAVMDFVVVFDTFLSANCVRREVMGDTGPSSPLQQQAFAHASDAKKICHSSFEMTVISNLCRNTVICELLPPTVAKHFSAENYPDLREKVRADVFEALIGMAYRCGIGLDRVRLLLRKLFSALPRALYQAQQHQSPVASDLAVASWVCPYGIHSQRYIEAIHSYATRELMDASLRRLIQPSGAAQLYKETASPMASTHLPHTQAKEYATHFTTRKTVSYHRLLSIDEPQLWNRVLSAFAQQSMTYVNEIVTEVAHFTIDLGGIAPRSWGLLRWIWEWYRKRFNCDAALLVMNSSGKSKSNGQWKDSCHLHFPQVTASVASWEQLQEEARNFIADRCDVVKGQLKRLFSDPDQYDILFHRRFVIDEVRRCGGSAKPHPLNYCSVEVLAELGRACRATRQIVLEHLAYAALSPQTLANVFEIAEAAQICYGAGEENSDVVILQHRTLRQRWMLPSRWVPLERLSRARRTSPCNSVKPHGSLMADAATSMTVGDTEAVVPSYPSRDFWGTTINPSLIQGRRLRLYLNDKWDMMHGQEVRPLLLETICLPPRAAKSVKGCGVSPAYAAMAEYHVTHHLPAFLSAVGDTTDSHASHRRRVKLRSLAALRTGQKMMRLQNSVKGLTAATESRPTAPAVVEVLQDAEDWGEMPVECAHASALRLSSLRSAEYRDVTGRVYRTWMDMNRSAVQGGTKALLPLSAAGDRPLVEAFHPQHGWSDTLPSFYDIYSARTPREGQLACQEWHTWATIFLVRPPMAVMTNASRPYAWSPVWWEFNPKRNRATLCVASEPVMQIANVSSLTMALSPSQDGGVDGMERFAQLVIPELRYNKVPSLKPYIQTYGTNFFPLFVEVQKVPKPLVASADTEVAAISKLELSRENTESMPAISTKPQNFVHCMAHIREVLGENRQAAPVGWPIGLQPLPVNGVRSASLEWLEVARYVFADILQQGHPYGMPLILYESTPLLNSAMAQVSEDAQRELRRSFPLIWALDAMPCLQTPHSKCSLAKQPKSRSATSPLFSLSSTAVISYRLRYIFVLYESALNATVLLHRHWSALLDLFMEGVEPQIHVLNRDMYDMLSPKGTTAAS